MMDFQVDRWAGPAVENKMEAMEAVELLEGFSGCRSLHETIWLGRKLGLVSRFPS